MKMNIISQIMQHGHRLKNAMFVARHYLRWTYPINRKQEYGDYCHEHTCLAAHLPNVKLTDICPLSGTKFQTGMEDACESCPYFCTIDYNEDAETREKSLHFYMSEDVVSTYSVAKHK